MKIKIQSCLILVLALSFFASGFCASTNFFKTQNNQITWNPSFAYPPNSYSVNPSNYYYPPAFEAKARSMYFPTSFSAFPYYYKDTPNSNYYVSRKDGKSSEEDNKQPLKIPQMITYLSKQQLIYLPFILQVLKEKRVLLINPSKLIRDNIKETNSISQEDSKTIVNTMLAENLLNFYFRNKLGGIKDNETDDDHQITYLNKNQLKFFPLIMDVINLKKSLMIKLDDKASQHLKDNENMSDDNKAKLKKIALIEALLNTYFYDPILNKSTLDTQNDNDDSSLPALKNDEDIVEDGTTTDGDTNKQQASVPQSVDNVQQTTEPQEKNNAQKTKAEEPPVGKVKPVPNETAVSDDNETTDTTERKKRIIKRK